MATVPHKELDFHGRTGALMTLTVESFVSWWSKRARCQGQAGGQAGGSCNQPLASFGAAVARDDFIS